MLSYVVKQHDADHRYKQVWRCASCGKTRELYRWPWTWFWLRVNRQDLVDEVVRPWWWLGACGRGRGFASNEILFVFMPFNLLIDAIDWIWSRMRYRTKHKFDVALEEAYRRGTVDGRSQERTRLRVKLARLDQLAAEADLEWRQLGGSDSGAGGGLDE